MTGDYTSSKIEMARVKINTNGVHNPMTNFNKHHILIEVTTYKKTKVSHKKRVCYCRIVSFKQRSQTQIAWRAKL